MAVDGIIQAYIINEEVYDPDSVIIQEGRTGDWVFVILEGRVKVKKQTGRGLITVDTLKEGDVVGEMVMLKETDGLRTASVVADGRVRLGILDKDRLEEEYESLSPQLKSLIRNLVLRLQETTRKASLLALS